VLFAVTALLLSLASLSVSGLFLARGSARDREIGTKLALGASPGRLARQLLAESLLIALAGGLLGNRSGSYCRASSHRFPSSGHRHHRVARERRRASFALCVSRKCRGGPFERSRSGLASRAATTYVVASASEAARR